MWNSGLYAQYKVRKTYKEFSRVTSAAGLSGAETAHRILQQHNLYDVGIEEVPGTLSDHYDPRAKVLHATCHEVLDNLGLDNEMLNIARELERIALEDEYFIERKLYPNVDFYSGIILQALGIPAHLFTVIFALARTVGWIAQWNEMIEDPHQKIGRPRQLYTGKRQRSYVALDQR